MFNKMKYQKTENKREVLFGCNDSLTEQAGIVLAQPMECRNLEGNRPQNMCANNNKEFTFRCWDHWLSLKVENGQSLL